MTLTLPSVLHFNVNRSLKMNSVPNIHRQMRKWTLMFIQAIPDTYNMSFRAGPSPRFRLPAVKSVYLDNRTRLGLPHIKILVFCCGRGTAAPPPEAWGPPLLGVRDRRSHPPISRPWLEPPLSIPLAP